MLYPFAPGTACRRAAGKTSAAINTWSGIPVVREVACRAGLSNSTETATADTLLAEELLDRFRAADIDG